jgi:hypothetical protein
MCCLITYRYSICYVIEPKNVRLDDAKNGISYNFFCRYHDVDAYYVDIMSGT